MDKVKILHCGDFHFDSPFTGLLDKGKSRIRREELRETFKRVVNLAQTELVDILLIAGDLFDGDSVQPETIRFIADSLYLIPDIHVFLSPGNHDPIARIYSEQPNGNADVLLGIPNLHIFKNELSYEEVITKNGNTVRIYGRGFANAIQREGFLSSTEFANAEAKGILPVDKDKLNILLMHGEVNKTFVPSDYNPVTEAELSRAGFDYAALGHRHNYSGICNAGYVKYAYCGCPEGRGFDETGAKGVILGDIEKGRTNLEFVRTCRRQYHVLNLNVTDCATNDQLFEAVMKDISDANKASDKIGEQDLLDIKITGIFPKGFIPSTDVLNSKLQQNFFFCKISIESIPDVDIDELRNEYSLKGIFVQKMLTRIESPDVSEAELKLFENALNIGLNVFENQQV
jgi:DNA repair exonuclease SbcCD nuclease subunit